MSVGYFISEIIMAAKSKKEVTLKSEEKSYIEIDAYDFDGFVKAITGFAYETVPTLECSNDSYHSFFVETLMSEWAEEEWVAFKKNGEHAGVRTVLNGLCHDGHIKPGNYLISVCW